jgi:prevent-host-death family protein
MQRIQLNKDIRPLSEFRSKVAFYFNKVNRTKRPLIITQHGKSAAVLMGVPEYEALLDKIEVLEDIRLAESQISDGKGISNKEVKKRLLMRLNKQ